MQIRKIHPGDIDSLLNIIHQYADEAAESMPEIAGEIDDAVIVENIRKWSIQHTFNLLVAFEGERPVGFIAGLLVTMPWSQTLQANVNFIFMTKTHRTMENFKALLNAFEEWAKSAGCKKIFSGDIGIDIERSRKLYNYLGFTEGLYVTKELK
jgi:GNAT superfamily N-acetyltransferase